MSPSTRILSTSGRAPSTASRASRLLWTSERSARVRAPSFPSPRGEGVGAASGGDAFVGVDEENAQGGGDRNRDEEPEGPSQRAAHHEGGDDQHVAQGDRGAEHL